MQLQGYNWLSLTILQATLHHPSLLLFKIGNRLFHPIAGFLLLVIMHFNPDIYSLIRFLFTTQRFLFFISINNDLLLTRKTFIKRLTCRNNNWLTFLRRQQFITFFFGLFICILSLLQMRILQQHFISCSLINDKDVFWQCRPGWSEVFTNRKIINPTWIIWHVARQQSIIIWIS